MLYFETLFLYFLAMSQIFFIFKLSMAKLFFLFHQSGQFIGNMALSQLQLKYE